MGVVGSIDWLDPSATIGCCADRRWAFAAIYDMPVSRFFPQIEHHELVIVYLPRACIWSRLSLHEAVTAMMVSLHACETSETICSNSACDSWRARRGGKHESSSNDSDQSLKL